MAILRARSQLHGEKTFKFSVQSSPIGLLTRASISLECAACVVPARTIFSIDSQSGQISTVAALDHEAKSSWSVIVRANDGQGGVDATRTRILVGDVDEPVCSPTSAGCVRVCELDGLDLR